MGNLLDDLRTDQDPRTACRLCVWLLTRPLAERNDWAEAFTDHSYTQTSLFRAARARGFMGGIGSVNGHRKGLHA